MDSRVQVAVDGLRSIRSTYATIAGDGKESTAVRVMAWQTAEAVDKLLCDVIGVTKTGPQFHALVADVVTA